MQKNPEAVVEPKILIYRLDYPLMFINASWMRESLRERVRAYDPSPLIVILDMQFSHELHIQGLDKLTSESKPSCAAGLSFGSRTSTSTWTRCFGARSHYQDWRGPYLSNARRSG